MFYGEIWKIIPKLSSFTHHICFSGLSYLYKELFLEIIVGVMKMMWQQEFKSCILFTLDDNFKLWSILCHIHSHPVDNRLHVRGRGNYVGEVRVVHRSAGKKSTELKVLGMTWIDVLGVLFFQKILADIYQDDGIAIMKGSV